MEESTRATLADLLTYKESPLLIKEEDVRQPRQDVIELGNAHHLFFDGSYRKSHDAASGGIVLYDPQGQLMYKQGVKVDAHTNNEAEYATLDVALQICLKHGVRRVCIKGDALLVVKQVLGVWKSKNTTLREMCTRIKGVLKKFEAWSLRHIDRSQNVEAHNASQVIVTEVFVLKSCAPMYCG